MTMDNNAREVTAMIKWNAHSQDDEFGEGRKKSR
jgi:hypothetical protein